MHLVLLVPVHVHAQRRVQGELVRVAGSLGEGGLRGVCAAWLGDHVLHLLAGPHGAPPGLQAQRHLDVGLVLRVGVILRILGEALRDDVLLERHLLLVHRRGLLGEVAVHPLDRLLLALSVEDLQEHFLADLLGQPAPVPPDDVQALDLGLEHLLLPIDHLDSGILLFLQQHHGSKHAVDLDLQLFILLVDRSLDLLCCLHGLIEILGLRIHEHRVRVPIDHIQREFLLDHRDGGLQRLAAL
mmetsp:Transcript_52299/g.136174  ORF Transcript_52299/g.136174 Transcript_52299/m.136174 type:complete len:242 (+) Transcript_52299:867-1592(+)